MNTIDLLRALREATIQGSIAILLAMAACRVFPGMPPTARLWVWRIALLKLLISVLPIQPIALAVLPSTTSASPVLARMSGPSEAIPIEFSLWAAVWMIGAVAVIVRTCMGVVRVRGLLRAAVPVTDVRVLRAFGQASLDHEMTSGPTLLEHDDVHGPMLVGFRGVVLVPSDFAASADDDGLRLALAHELAHLRSRDLLWRAFHVVAQAAFFFNPLVWLGVREATKQQEMHADALALRATKSDPSRYAEMLLALSRPGRYSTASHSMAIGLSAQAASLRDRIQSLYTVSSSPVVRVLALICCLVALTGAMPWALVERGSAAPNKAMYRGTFEDELGFTVDQRLAMTGIVEDQNRMIGLAKTQRERRLAIWKTNVAIRDMLSASQRVKFDELIGHPDRLRPKGNAE
jgi:beta-lactamase regulating signal transducer with metallopeptidase domain